MAAKGLLEQHGPEAVMARLFGLGAIALSPVLVVEVISPTDRYARIEEKVTRAR